MLNPFKKILIFSVFTFATLTSHAQTPDTVDRNNVIAQMNYCITTLTNIIHNKSMAVLEHESDQLLNNLTMEQMVGLYEINDFRIELLDAVSRFEITEEERALLKRVQSMKRDNAKWTALSNALSPTMLLTGSGPGMGYQMAFQTLLTAARSVVEYKVAQGEQEIEELEAMWELRKEDMKVINDVRKSALNIVFNLYNKYHLNENDRLTEDTATKFSTYISDPNAAKRIRLLESYRSTYEKMASYYYHLGMAYVDVGNYEKAKTNFITYLNMYKQAPILRHDEMSGCIALTRLTYETNLSSSDKRYLVNIALKNLPSNSAAVLQCAMVLIYDIKDTESGLRLIQTGLDDPYASDKDLLYMAAANLMPVINKYPQLKKEIANSFQTENSMSVDTYITFLINAEDNCWNDLSNLINFRNVSSRDWSHLGIGTDLNENLHIIFPERYVYNVGDICLYIETHDKDGIEIQEMRPEFANGISIDDIEKVNCFKANKNLKYLFCNVIEPNSMFCIKDNIDYEKLKSGEYPHMFEFVLTDKDVNDIIKFCKKHTQKETSLLCVDIDDEKYFKQNLDEEIVIKFYGDSLRYSPHHSAKQSGYYLRMSLSNGIIIMYKYNPHDKNLSPYFYSYEDKTVFINDVIKEEYLCTVPPIEGPTFMSTVKSTVSETGSKVGTYIKNVFSNKKENNETKDK